MYVPTPCVQSVPMTVLSVMSAAAHLYSCRWKGLRACYFNADDDDNNNNIIIYIYLRAGETTTVMASASVIRWQTKG